MTILASDEGEVEPGSPDAGYLSKFLVDGRVIASRFIPPPAVVTECPVVEAVGILVLRLAHDDAVLTAAGIDMTEAHVDPTECSAAAATIAAGASG